MRTLVASTLYVSLATAIFAQQPNEADRAERIAFTNRQVRLVDSYRDSGDYPAAERVLRKWLASEPAGSDAHIMVQNALADLLREEGLRTEAKQLFTQVIDAPRATPHQRLNALIGLADIDMNLGDWKTSVAEGNTALEGSLPVTTDGGTMSFSHAGANAQMLQRIIRGVQQLRGGCPSGQVQGAEVALCSNGGSGALFSDVLLLGSARP